MYHDAPVEAAVTVHRKRKADKEPAQARLQSRYRLKDVVDFLMDRPEPFLKVALQFPDDLLDDAVPIVQVLQSLLKTDPRSAAMEQKLRARIASSSMTPSPPASSSPAAPRPVTNTTVLDNPNAPTSQVRFTILADNTFGSCCPDEITAQHYANECIIHFGEACLSRSARIPVFYVLPVFSFRAVDQLVSAGAGVGGHTDKETHTCVSAQGDERQRLAATAESALVARVVAAQRRALEQHTLQWRRAHASEETPAHHAVRCQLVIVGAPEAQGMLAAAQSLYRDQQQDDAKTETADASATTDVTVSWCSYRDAPSTAPEKADTGAKNAPGGCGCAHASTTPLETASASSWPLDWAVNGVVFPRFIGEKEQAASATEDVDRTEETDHGAVQFFLFVGPSNAPHLVHLMAVQQYNDVHYSEAQRAFMEQVTDADGEDEYGMNVISALDETFGVAALADKLAAAANAWTETSAGDEGLPWSSAEVIANGIVRAALSEVDSIRDVLCASASQEALCVYDLKRLFTAACGAAQLLYQRRLRQRDFNIETLRASSAVGILVASLAIEGYYATTMLLHKLLRASGKRSYILYVGHLNEYKLANFVDSVDCFVAIACPNSRESHFPIKADNYLKPVVAPFEVLLAVAAEDENSPLYGLPAAYSTAFDYAMGPLATALKAATDAATAAGERGKSGQAHGASTDWGAVGALVRAGGTSSALVTQDAAVQGSLARLHERTYVGLDPQVGQTEVQSEMLDGLHGIARGYADERSRQ